MKGSADHSTDARKVADVRALLIDLKINEDTTLLFIVLGADGSINRSGSGTFKNKSGDMFIGKTDPAIFENVRLHLTEEMLQGLGYTFRPKEVRGAPCKLTLIFQFKDGPDGGSEYLYGSESEGPPGDVVDFVRAAVGETEGWYQDQLKMVSN